MILFVTSCEKKRNTNIQIRDELTFQDVYNKRVPAAKGWKYIIIHHSATSQGNAKSFHDYHTEQGYGGLAYHFVIGNGKGAKDGEVQTGFRWKEQIAGTHVTVNAWYHNIFGIGICLVGNFEKTLPTQKQIKSLINLIKELSKKHDIPRINIVGHGSVPHSNMILNKNIITVEYLEGKKEERTCPGRFFPMKRVLNQVFN
jgi:N-acetyl-anhydromuramyl-L-alanine amidase AmpD